MRLQLARLFCVVVIFAGVAHADEVVIRGNYWRDRNTRVIQPEVDVGQELPTGTVVGAHYLLDAITSASAAAGVIQDHPFTELRNEVGFRLGQRLGPSMNTVSYSYSSESDYWAHTLSVASTIDMFQKNSTLGLVTTYGSDTIAQRQGPTIYNRLGGLQTFGFIGSWTQVLHKYALGIAEYDLTVQGFGSAKGLVTGAPTNNTGFQGNAYRAVNLGGSPNRETVPYQRIRQSISLALHLFLPTGGVTVPYLAFRPSYRYYTDDWGVHAHAVELRTYLPIGPAELRLTGRYYTQTAASFASNPDDVPSYTGNASKGLPCTTCDSSFSRGGHLFYTADPKLSAFDSMFIELRVMLRLEVIFGRLRHPIPRWLAQGQVEISYGHYFDDRLAHSTFGDADLGSLAFLFPL